MAINPIEFPSDKTVVLSKSSFNKYKHGNSPQSRLVTEEFTPFGRISNLPHKHGKYKNNLDSISPYLKNHSVLGDSVQLLSRVTEKRFVHKNGGNVISSFPLAANIYKTNRDEYKAKQANKKLIKSVLTLPNNIDTSPQLCTINDMHDAQLLSGKEDVKTGRRNRIRKSEALRKYLPISKRLESESQYYSDTVDSSSADTIKKCRDGKKTQKANVGSRGVVKEKLKPHDVWAVLRNMNRFQFQTSPRISEDSFIGGRQKNLRRRNNRKDLRVLETRRTEEFAYISSYKVPKSPSLSPCSSFDKITVIDKAEDLKIIKEIKNKPKKKRAAKLIGLKAIPISPKDKPLPVKQCSNLKALTYANQMNQKENDDTATYGLSGLVNMKKMVSEHPDCNKELNYILNNNASVDLGYESKTTENDEDFISFGHNTTNAQASQCSQSKLSDNSGSSKAAAFTKHIKHTKVKPKLKTEFDNQITGITKVILSRGQNSKEKLQQHDFVGMEPLKKNIHQTVMMPSSPPKLTRTEINRQLQKYRFPVVILGKDQLRTSVHVANADHPQFDGLDKQIWPFMSGWYGLERPVKVIKKQINPNIHSKKTRIDEIEKKAQLKKNVSKTNNISSLEHKRIPLPLSELINETTQNQTKLKPIKQLKDRMIKFLSKNSSEISVINDHPSSVTYENNHTLQSIHIVTDSQDKYKTNTNLAENVNKSATQKRPWAKAKWASDFIENVIKKIKSGTFYNQDIINKIGNETPVVESKETDVQTDSISDLNSDVSFYNNCNITNENSDESLKNVIIPGFDNVPPVLEIKTISINEVAVKHCGTNIVVHFDVTVPTTSIVDTKRDSSLIPIDITESLTKVFKCQTSIINAILPAEICSIVPHILRDVVETDQRHAFFTAPIDKPCHTTISKLPILRESFVDILTPTLAAPSVSPLTITWPSKLQQVFNGGYFKKTGNETPQFHVVRTTSNLAKNENQFSKEIKPHIERKLLFDIDDQLKMPLNVMTYRQEKRRVLKTDPIQRINTCSALQLYQRRNEINTCTTLQSYSHGLASMLRPFSLMSVFETMATYINNLGLSCFRMIKTDNNLAFNINIEKSLRTTNVVTLRIANLQTESLNVFSNCLNSCKFNVLTDIDETSIKKDKTSAVCEKLSKNLSLNNNKIRRKSYVKLYKKCKKLSKTNGEKITPLSRIVDLDDFLQALGPGKLLSSVFDAQSGNKIMLSIQEFKKWTAIINPRQALLVVLLSNKKETPNLKRYRPMLLQGIAVKRITKAIELDMEIEVIERENLNGISRFEGITYLPASFENQDRLYEELCWIAKNTASDYQKPFDHNSEKLLKSLLEKRKQLNPSYLRVMARYVGLGLLKSPVKRQ